MNILINEIISFSVIAFVVVLLAFFSYKMGKKANEK
jgi:hypothetical protein